MLGQSNATLPVLFQAFKALAKYNPGFSVICGSVKPAD
jgi:hypothetical protein